MSFFFFLAMRIFHILVAAVWLGAVAFVSALLMPAIQQAGSAGGEVMARLMRRGLHTFMAVLGGTTILSGIWLYWRYTGGFNSTETSSHGGLAFGIGGVAGLLAGIIGGSVVGRSVKRAVALAEQAAGTSNEAERTTLLDTAAGLRARAAAASRFVLVLLVIAMVFMSAGHYV
jgi:uncharacterized membrane protein